jgi:hypothetical protein
MILALVTVFVTAKSSGAAVIAWTDVTVRAYDAAGLDDKTRRAALDLATTALAAASVEITWRVCSGGPTHAAYCDARLAPGELAVRIVRTAPAADHSGGLRLGDALVDSHAGSGVLATVYLSRILTLAQQTNSNAAVLLGRAIAHELGHLLMASNAHGTIGLMRAFWSQDEMRASRPADWIFAPRDARAIQMGARANQARQEHWGTN